jgi:N-acetylmuramoyl-L-alanine amidase
MKRREFICVLGSIASGFLPRRRTIIVAMAAMVLLPIEVGHAGWLSDLFKGSKQTKSSKQAKLSKQAASPKPAALTKRAVSPKRHAVKLAALGPVQ